MAKKKKFSRRVILEVSYRVGEDTDEAQVAAELARFVNHLGEKYTRAEHIIVNTRAYTAR